MAFSSLSGFGAKPATGTTPSLFGQPSQPAGSLFGQSATTNQQQQPSGGLFGQPASGTQQSTPATGLFGQPTNTNQPATGLFGQSNTTSTQPSTVLFGAAPAQQSTTNTQPSTGLFGQPAASTATQPSTGLFGQPSAQPSAGLFGQPASNATTQPSTGLFGQPASNTTQPNTGLFGQPSTNAPQPSTGMFGQSTTNAAQPSTGLFGQSTATAQPSTGLFGQSTAQPSTGTGLFGSTAQSQQTGLFGGSNNTSTLFGGPKPQPSLSTVPQGQVPFTKSTKFNDLPDELKRVFENIESHIQGRIQIGNTLKQRKVGEEALKGQALIQNVHKELVSSTTTAHADLLFTQDLKAKVDQAVQDTIAATRIIDGFGNPKENAANLKSYADFPLEYFSRVTAQMRERLDWYKSTIEQIERKLSSSASQIHQSPQAITSTLQVQNATFLSLASKVAALEADLDRIRKLYTQLWRKETGSMRDPFNELDRGDGDFGLQSLSVR